MKFPQGFLMGASTAAHQVEGNNVNSDFWAMEQVSDSMFQEPSGDSVDHYNRYREDIDLMASASLNAYRFSIEWARIQPTKDIFDEKEIEHYRDMLIYCREKGIEPIVTMHHFSSPRWLISQGGWESEDTIGAFAAYCEYVVKQLGDLMSYVCTINEANMGIQLMEISRDTLRNMGMLQVGTDVKALMTSRYTPLSPLFDNIEPTRIATFLMPRTDAGDKIICMAHEAARDAMKSVCPHLQIGLTLSLYDIQVQPGGEENAQEKLENDFLHYLPYMEKDDFIGLQNYTRKRIGPDGTLPNPEGAEVTQMNYEFYPKAIGNVVRYVAGIIDKPIMITENGVATDDDSRREVFIQEALGGIMDCINDGIPVRGYLHWSLLDNFEWMMGYKITFGLVAVDKETQTRYPKNSLKLLGSYIG